MIFCIFCLAGGHSRMQDSFGNITWCHRHVAFGAADSEVPSPKFIPFWMVNTSMTTFSRCFEEAEAVNSLKVWKLFQVFIICLSAEQCESLRQPCSHIDWGRSPRFAIAMLVVPMIFWLWGSCWRSTCCPKSRNMSRKNGIHWNHWKVETSWPPSCQCRLPGTERNISRQWGRATALGYNITLHHWFQRDTFGLIK